MIDDGERIIRIEDKLDHIKDSISSINETLAAQHESLKDHMRRTELLEEAIEPVKARAAKLDGLIALVGGIATIAVIIEGFTTLFAYLRAHR